MLYFCGGLTIFILVFGFLSLRKSRGANSNYTEFAMDEHNHISTFRDRTDYGDSKDYE